MQTIKRALRAVRRWRLPQPGDPQQARALGRVLRFFAAVLVLTLVARGAAGALMPVVALESARRGSVMRTEALAGVVEPLASLPLGCPAGLIVQSLLAQPGQTLTAGQPIAAFDEGEVKLALRQGKAQLQKLNAQLAALGRETPVEAAGLEEAQYAERWALEEYDRLMADDDAGDEARRAAEQALTRARLALEAAKRAYLQAVEDAKQAAGTNAAEAALVRVQVSEQKKANEALEALLAAGCTLTAPQEGLLTRLELVPGQPSAAAAGLLTSTEAGYRLELELTPEQAKQVKEGAQAEVTQGQTKASLALPVLVEGEGGAAKAALALPADQNWKAGSAEVKLTLFRTEAACCVSPGAVHYSAGGAYVLLVRRQNTVLGLQNLVEKLPVTVEKVGDDLVAVSGALQPGDAVIASASRAVGPGDRVRVAA